MVKEDNKSGRVRALIVLKWVGVKEGITKSNAVCVPFWTPIDFMTLAILETWIASSPYVTLRVWPGRSRKYYR